MGDLKNRQDTDTGPSRKTKPKPKTLAMEIQEAIVNPSYGLHPREDVAAVLDARGMGWGPGKDLPEEWDGREYDGEENPHNDPDEYEIEIADDSRDWTNVSGPLEASANAPSCGLSHRIVIDAWGDVSVVGEDRLLEDNPSRWLNLRMEYLREIGRMVVERNREGLLDGPENLEEFVPAPLLQKDLAQNIQGLDKSKVSQLVLLTRVETPLWGEVPLSVFTEGAIERGWQVALEEVKRLVEGEDTGRPLKTTDIWNELKRMGLIEEHASDRMLRNKMKEYGIPVEGRHHVRECVVRWMKDDEVRTVRERDLSAMVESLFEDYGLFEGKRLSEYREPRFRPWVEKRLRRVLEELGVEVL